MRTLAACGCNRAREENGRYGLLTGGRTFIRTRSRILVDLAARVRGGP